MRLETVDQSGGAFVQITGELIGETLQLLLALLNRAVAARGKLAGLLVGNVAQDLAERRRGGFGCRVKLRAGAPGNLTCDRIELLMNLNQAPGGLFLQSGLELARGLRRPFLKAASRRNERLLDQHLQTRACFLLEPFRRLADRLSSGVRGAYATGVELFAPLRERLLAGAFKIVAKACNRSRDLRGHIALAVVRYLAEPLAM